MSKAETLLQICEGNDFSFEYKGFKFHCSEINPYAWDISVHKDGKEIVDFEVETEKYAGADHDYDKEVAKLAREEFDSKHHKP